MPGLGEDRKIPEGTRNILANDANVAGSSDRSSRRDVGSGFSAPAMPADGELSEVSEFRRAFAADIVFRCETSDKHSDPEGTFNKETIKKATIRRGDK
jgi:hypothetical protein